MPCSANQEQMLVLHQMRPPVRHVQHDGADHARQPCRCCGAAGARLHAPVTLKLAQADMTD